MAPTGVKSAEEQAAWQTAFGARLGCALHSPRHRKRVLEAHRDFIIDRIRSGRQKLRRRFILTHRKPSAARLYQLGKALGDIGCNSARPVMAYQMRRQTLHDASLVGSAVKRPR